jgi:2-amino-4-hydroxy-6-hydroxymethyldihydropteridine diphosphokinase
VTVDAPVTLYISGGSNIAPEENLRLATRELKRRYGEVTVSPVYRTPAVGFEGEPFLNCVYRLSTSEPAGTVVAFLESLHDLAGRERGPDPFSPRTLDLDLLLYGDAIIPDPPIKVPRNDIREYAFVLKPLADIAPDLAHPEGGETMAELWQNFDGPTEGIEQVDVDLQAR